MAEDEPEHDEPDYEPEPPDDPEPDEPEPPDPSWEEGGQESTFIHWPHDPQIDKAKGDLIAWFAENPTDVFYGRQLEVILEKKHFHWITHKALRELTNEGAVVTEMRTTPGSNNLRLYWSEA